jgi:hypothetical protein
VSSSVLFSFRMVPVISSMLAMRRIDTGALLREAGLPREALHGEVIAPLSRVQKFIDLAAARGGMPLLGLELADRVPAGAFGLTEFLMRSTPNVEAALRVSCEFSPLINPMLEFRYVRHRDAGCVHFAIASQRDVLGRHLNECTLGLAVRQFSSVLGERLTLERAWFAHGRRTQAGDVAARLGCDVAFEAPDCGFALSRAWLARTGLPPADIARRLGFSSVAAMRRSLGD